MWIVVLPRIDERRPTLAAPTGRWLDRRGDTRVDVRVRTGMVLGKDECETVNEGCARLRDDELGQLIQQLEGGGGESTGTLRVMFKANA